MEDSVMQKTCSQCGKMKSTQDFHLHKQNGGLRSKCKACAAENTRNRKIEIKNGIVSDHAMKKAEKEHLFQQGLIQCPNCQEAKPFSDFYTNPSRKNGHNTYCKKCSPRMISGAEHRKSTVERYLSNPIETKMCYTCKQTKPIEEFHLRKRGDPIRGRMSDCKDCQKARLRGRYHRSDDKERHRIVLRSHNVTKEQYAAMLEAQDGVCSICKQKETAMDPRTGLTRNLSIDHNHETGAIRELLCSRCNIMIGLAKDNIETLTNAIRYLEKHEA